MGNIFISYMAPPDKQREFVGRLNKWKYPTKGKYFKGSQAPYVCEIRFYEIRMPEEHEAQFITDMDLSDLLSKHGGATRNWKYKVLDKLMNFCRKFTPFKPLVKEAPTKKYQMPGFHYAFAFGRLQRKKMKVETGGEREVM